MNSSEFAKCLSRMKQEEIKAISDAETLICYCQRNGLPTGNAETLRNQILSSVFLRIGAFYKD